MRFPSSHVALAGVCILLGAACASAPRGSLKGKVNFGDLFDQKTVSNTVHLQPRQRELMKRVLLSPNLVFESSRSSSPEPPTAGPANPHAASPYLPDALGRPVSIDLSTLLIRHLSSKGSALLAPVVTRKWGNEWNCQSDKCPKGSWAERVFLLNQAARSGASAGPSPEELPTAAFAVRVLGIGSRRVGVVINADEDKEGVFTVAPRRNAKESSECDPDTWFEVPVVAFSAEVVSMQDGRILSRVDEELPVQMKDYRRTFSYPQRASDAVLCNKIFGAYRTFYQEILDNMNVQLPAMLGQVFTTSLAPLYE